MFNIAKLSGVAPIQGKSIEIFNTVMPQQVSVFTALTVPQMRKTGRIPVATY